MAYSAIVEIGNSFNDMASKVGSTGRPKNLTRYLGGHSRTGHPYVNGYWQFFIAPPAVLFKNLDGALAGEWFHATAESFTPPSRNVTKGDVPGQGGLGSSWVTGQSLQRTFSVTHREYRDVPILKLYQLWTSVIVPHVGVSEIAGEDWMGTSYKGHAFAVLTKPVGQNNNNGTKINGGNKWDIEDFFYFDGVWPENEPVDTLNQDISGNDLVTYTMNFSFDGWPLMKQDTHAFVTLSNLLNLFEYQKTYDIYTTDVIQFESLAPVGPANKGFKTV